MRTLVHANSPGRAEPLQAAVSSLAEAKAWPEGIWQSPASLAPKEAAFSEIFRKRPGDEHSLSIL